MLKSKEKLNPRKIHQSYLETIENDLSNEGVVFFDSSRLDIEDSYLSLPSEITEVPSRQLGEYLNAFTQQKIYLRTILGRTELQVEDSRRKYMEASAEAYRELSNSKMSETAKERIINSSEEVQPFYYEYIDYKNKLKLVEYSINNIEDIIFMLSREVTRRTGDFAEENRNYNVSRR